jgi:hypothetical protein
MLLAKGGLVSTKRLFVPLAANAFEHGGERPPISLQRLVRFGSMDRVAMVGNRVARFQMDRDFARSIGITVIADAL